LDLDAVLWLDNYLSEVYPHAVVVVSHDADFLDSICTDILHLEARKLVHYRGDYTAFKKMHNQKRQQQDKEFKKQQDELKALKRKGKTREEAEELIKKKFGIDLHDNLMEKQKDYIVKFNFVGHGMDRSLGLNVSEVAFSYDGKEPWLLEGCEMGVDCGSRIAIVGPNGAGKSTLLNLMMQQLEPCLGEVSTSKGIRIRQYHQHFEELLPLDKTGVEYLQSAFDLSPPEKARAVLGQFGLPGASHFTKIGNLSGGQKARVAFAALMLSKPHIIILDEPTNHLDIESVEALTEAVSKFNGGLVLVTHDARLITEIDCELWVVEDGGCYRFEKGFEGYRDKVLDQLREREEEVERMEQQRREARAAKRAKHVDEERLKAARKKLAEQEQSKVQHVPKQADTATDSVQQTAEKDSSQHAVTAQGGSAKELVSPIQSEDGRDQSIEDSAEQATTPPPEASTTKVDVEVKAAPEDRITELKASEADSDEEDDAKLATQASECDEDVDAKHDEYLIGEVMTLRAMKQKKGFIFCEIDVGRDENVPVVTNRKSVQLGSRVVIAVEGATVGGEEVVGDHLHSEWSAGVVCSPIDMGWEGDANECITLHGNCEVGDFAPASKHSPLLVRPSAEVGDAGKAQEDDAVIDRHEEDDDERGTAGAKAKAKGKAKKSKSKQEELDKDEDDGDGHSSAKAKAKSKAKAQTKKSRGRKGAEDNDEDDDDDNEDDNVAVAKAKAKAKSKVQNKKGRGKRDDDTEEEEEDHEVVASKVKAKSKAKAQGKKSKGKRDDEDDEDEDEDLRASKAKGRRGRGKHEDESEDDPAPAAKSKPLNISSKRGEGSDADEVDGALDQGSTEVETAAAEEQTGKNGAKHSEFKVAQVVSADGMKKKKGSLLVELQIGGDTVSVVTSYANVEAGQRVILAPEGSTVSGKEVKRQKVAGEWTAGVLCGPMELGWPGDASCCIVLDDTHEVGDFAPAGPGGNFVSTSSAGLQQESKEQPGIGEDEDENEEEGKGDAADDDKDEKGGKRKDAVPQVAKTKGRKSKTKDDEDDTGKMGEDSDDDDGRRGKKKGKRR